MSACFVSLLLTACTSQSELDSAYDSGYSDGEMHGYESGYENGYEDGEEDALYNLQKQFPGGQLIYIADNTLDVLEEYSYGFYGFDYIAEEYVYELSNYFDAHEYYMTEDQKTAFSNILNYYYKTDELLDNIMYGLDYE